MLLIENGPTLRPAADVWSLLERLANPAVGCCWSLHSSQKAGESPSVAIPTLNSRIQHVRFPAVAVTPTLADVPVRLAVQRLRGIGYEQYVSVPATSRLSVGTTTLAVVHEKLLNWASPKRSESASTSAKKR